MGERRKMENVEEGESIRRVMGRRRKAAEGGNKLLPIARRKGHREVV